MEKVGNGNSSSLQIEQSEERCDTAAVNQDLKDVTEPAIKVVSNHCRREYAVMRVLAWCLLSAQTKCTQCGGREAGVLSGWGIAGREEDVAFLRDLIKRFCSRGATEM